MTAPKVNLTTQEEALEHIRAERLIWIRCAAERGDDDVWQARLLELTSGDAPPSWEARTWEYPAALFIADRQSGEAVATFLRSGAMTIGDRLIRLPQLTTQAAWERRQSRSSAPYETLDWPVTETRLSMLSGAMAERPGPLISEGDAPSFLSFYAAAACFFWLDRRPAGGSLDQGVMYRHQDTRARITAVRIGTDVVSADVDGADLDGLIVELPGDVPGPSQRLWRRYGEEPQTASFPLKEGLPAGSWVVVRQGSQWLDRRFLSVPYARGNEAGVTIAIEAGTRLDELVSRHEHQTVEFKRQVPKDDDGKLKMMKTVCAFANGQGGSVLIGVDDDRELIGLDARSTGRLSDQLSQLVGSWLEPRPSVSIDVLPIPDSDKVVLELLVAPGVTLYGCGRPGDIRTPYIRHQGVTEKASVHEVTAIVQSRTSIGGGITFPDFG